MKRKPSGFSVMISLPACLIAVTAWVASYRPGSPAGFAVPAWRFHSTRGALWVSYYASVAVFPSSGFPVIPIEHSPIPGLHFRTASISHPLGPGLATIEVLREYGVDYWLIVALTLVPPAVWLKRRVLHRKSNPGKHCRTCGYNLTGNTSGVCPECGAKVSVDGLPPQGYRSA